MKLKQCRHCKSFLPVELFSSTQARYCTPCKVAVRFEQRHAMMERSLARTKLKKQKTVQVMRISDLKKKVQIVVNRYIRLRDANEPCISCQKDCGKDDAGHYIAQGSSGALRYNHDNIHKQGVGCNRFKHGNLVEYRINLVKKIGLDRVEVLEQNRHDIKMWTREELNQIYDEHIKLLKDME